MLKPVGGKASSEIYIGCNNKLSPIRSVTVWVINKIGRPRNRRYFRTVLLSSASLALNAAWTSNSVQSLVSEARTVALSSVFLAWNVAWRLSSVWSGYWGTYCSFVFRFSSSYLTVSKTYLAPNYTCEHNLKFLKRRNEKVIYTPAILHGWNGSDINLSVNFQLRILVFSSRHFFWRYVFSFHL